MVSVGRGGTNIVSCVLSDRVPPGDSEILRLLVFLFANIRWHAIFNWTNVAVVGSHSHPEPRLHTPDLPR